MEEEERGHQILQLANYWLKVGPGKKVIFYPKKMKIAGIFFRKSQIEFSKLVWRSEKSFFFSKIAQLS